MHNATNGIVVSPAQFQPTRARIPYHLALAVAVAAVACLPAVPAADGQCPASFATPVNYAAGAGSTSLAIADLNGDGKLDLAVANFNESTVSVLLGNGDGTFRPAVNYAAGGNNPNAVAIYDLDGDNKFDLVVANTGTFPTYAGNVSVLLGNGDGTFRPAVSYNAGSAPAGVAISDLNGDHRPDLVVANDNDNTVSVLLGNGDGTFRPAVSYHTGNGPYSVAIGDLNGDGHPDLVVANNNASDISVLLGNGDGTFQTAVNYGVGLYPISVAIGDLSGDGQPDLAVANSNDNTVSVLLGNGDGTFRPAVNYNAGSDPSSVAIDDLNGDGKLDLVVADFVAGDVSVLQGNGDGAFQPAVAYAAGSGPGSVAIADLNGDGRLDLAVADFGANNVAVLANTGLGVTINHQPASQTVTLGQNATFSAAASGATSYLWRRNGRPLTNGGRFSGVTTGVLTVTGATNDEFGVYDVQLGAACGAGIISQAAALSVIPLKGDINGDGVVNFADINPFVTCLVNGGCP